MLRYRVSLTHTTKGSTIFERERLITGRFAKLLIWLLS